jgi:uncharacterized membrane protein
MKKETVKDLIYSILASAAFGLISTAILGTALMYLENERPIFKGENEQFKKFYQRLMVTAWVVNSLIFFVIDCLQNHHSK